MAATINTNIASINAQRNLALSGQSLNTTMQRLSSGLRVNSAKDDAAGLAIAERMNTQVKGLTVASRNANDGISLAQTAEGALGKVGDMLQRMRELAVQASNATNSASDRKALQAEVSQLAAEIDRVAKQTNFNGQKILDGSFAGAVFQVGANSGDNVTLGALADTRAGKISTITYASNTVTFDTNDNPTPAITEFDQTIPAGKLSITVGAFTTEIEKIEPANSSLERLGQIVTAINNKTTDTGVTAYMTLQPGTQQYSIELMSSKLDAQNEPLAVTFNGFEAATTGVVAAPASPFADFSSSATSTPIFNTFTSAAAAVSGATSNTAAAVASAASAANDLAKTPELQSLAHFWSAELSALNTASDASAGSAATALKDKIENVVKAYDARGKFETANPKDLAAVKTYAAALKAVNSTASTYEFTSATDLTEASAELSKLKNALGINSLGINLDASHSALDQRGVDNIDVTTQAGAWIALKKIDSAIDQVNSARATLGAMQTRFENAVNNIDIQVENLSAARGRIVDADFAVETANLSRTQILQQAGTAMVAQANQIPQNVLQLLQG